MTRREYIKYNSNFPMLDVQHKQVNIGDTVVINNHYGASPYIGVVDHFTESGKLAIQYNWGTYKGVIVKCWAYRESTSVVKIKNGNKGNSKNRS